MYKNEYSHIHTFHGKHRIMLCVSPIKEMDFHETCNEFLTSNSILEGFGTVFNCNEEYCLTGSFAQNC